MSERKLASIRKIRGIGPIEGADAIELATIDGWQVVVKKNEFKVGDLVVYFEIDSWVPTEIAPFLSKGKEPRVYEGVKGERLRTVTLRGALSQGLVIPITDELRTEIGFSELHNEGREPQEGDDVTQILGIKKWEPDIPACLAGQVKGYFPGWITKTDQERAQNLVEEIRAAYERGDQFEVTIKLDGTSFTGYHRDGEVGVCSRNLELKLNEANKDNTFVKLFEESGLSTALQAYGRNIAIQGEVMGPGIQGNREKLKEPQLFVFDIYDIDTRKYLGPAERMKVFNALKAIGVEMQHVPVLNESAELPSADVGFLLKVAEGKSLNHEIREGLVWKSVSGDFSFKTISNLYLLKGGN